MLVSALLSSGSRFTASRHAESIALRFLERCEASASSWACAGVAWFTWMSLTLMALLRATRRAVSGFRRIVPAARVSLRPPSSGVQSARAYASGWVVVANCRRRNYFTGRTIILASTYR